MPHTPDPLAQHRVLTRRYFLRLGAAGLAAAPLVRWAAADESAPGREALDAAIEKLEYLTPPDDFGTVERGNPLPYKLPSEKLREVGLVRDTWRLEVVSDPENPATMDNPLTKQAGNALDFAGLMELAKKRAVRFFKVVTCNNIAQPLGMGLWEGVPLRDVVWQTRPKENIRRIFYHGYHNEDPKQLFQSSLAAGRVLEDPPGTPPVILCYKLNGEPLSGKRGGPVRMIVPEAYGFKSVKWLTRVVLSNLPHANDTYARGNNDLDSPMKTCARFVSWPDKLPAGTPIPLTGLCQVGISGLSRAQVWLHNRAEELDEEADPHFTKAPWQDAELLPPPEDWGGGLPDGRLPEGVRGIDPKSGRPSAWPQPYTLTHWARLLPGVPAGKYEVRCRTIDANGYAQPMPRPFRKSGRNSIQRVLLTVT